jgi:hypothetical protein
MPNATVRASTRAMPKSQPKSETKVSPAVERMEPDCPSFLPPADEVPDLYALLCTGDCMTPEIPDGARVLVDKREPVKAGDLVIIWLQSGRRPKLKRLAIAPPPWVKFPFRENPNSEATPLVIVEMINPSRTFQIRCDAIAAMHKCMGLVPDHVETFHEHDPERATVRGQEPRPPRAKSARPTAHGASHRGD